MADISQVKLPNGDTFDLVDEKSGYGKVHIIDLTYQGKGTDQSGEHYNIWTSSETHSQIKSYIDNNDIVILNQDSDWIPFNHCEYDDNTGNIYLEFIQISNTNSTALFTSDKDTGATYWKSYYFQLLTLSTLPIYDGTVV